MRYFTLIEPRHPRPSSFPRNVLLIALGLAILTALVLSDAGPSPAAAEQAFSETRQSLSFMPETVRLRTDP